MLAELDRIICNSDDLQGIEMELKNYDNLKRELEGIYDRRGWAAMVSMDRTGGKTYKILF